MTLLLGIGIYFALMTLVVLFFRFVRHADDDMREMFEDGAMPHDSHDLHPVVHRQSAA